MSKFRDAKTGGYISEEEAAMRDPATWVEEHEHPKNCSKELQTVYEECKKVASTPKGTGVFDGVAILPIYTLKKILNDFGANISPDE